MTTVKISPLTRVEGDLEVEIDVEDGRVARARATARMFRGFESLLLGRSPTDALVFAPRICGICGAAHSLASADALRDAYGARMPGTAYHARALASAVENVMSHFTHLYVLFLPDLADARYAGGPLGPTLQARFAAFSGSSYVEVVLARRELLEAIGLLLGKWPNTLGFQPGGLTAPLDASLVRRLHGIVRTFRAFVERRALGGPLEAFAALATAADLSRWLETPAQRDSDVGLFLRAGRDLGLDRLGAGPQAFLSFGVYEQPDGRRWLPGGFVDRAGPVRPLDLGKVTEHTARSWYQGDEPRHPLDGRTKPDVDKAGAYSWAKAPRYDGRPAEVGPLARLLVRQDPLMRDLLARDGANVLLRTLARVREGVLTLLEMPRWLDALLTVDEPACLPHEARDACQGVGAVEAARGVLGHWLRVEKGRIVNYQVITPTAWNISPRDATDVPGPIEQALVGTPIQDARQPLEAAHVVRSFDPCLVCTVHALRGRARVGAVRLGPDGIDRQG